LSIYLLQTTFKKFEWKIIKYLTRSEANIHKFEIEDAFLTPQEMENSEKLRKEESRLS